MAGLFTSSPRPSKCPEIFIAQIICFWLLFYWVWGKAKQIAGKRWAKPSLPKETSLSKGHEELRGQADLISKSGCHWQVVWPQEGDWPALRLNLLISETETSTAPASRVSSEDEVRKYTPNAGCRAWPIVSAQQTGADSKLCRNAPPTGLDIEGRAQPCWGQGCRS